MKTKLIQLKIGGKVFKVEYVKGLADNGSTDYTTQIINIKDENTEDGKLTSIIHECLEVLDETYDLKLPHQTIQTLEAGLFQIIKDNFNDK